MPPMLAIEDDAKETVATFKLDFCSFKILWLSMIDSSDLFSKWS